MTRREHILAAAEDAGSDFAYYRRKEDVELMIGDIQKAIAAGEVTMDEILSAFRKGVEDAG